MPSFGSPVHFKEGLHFLRNFFCLCQHKDTILTCAYKISQKRLSRVAMVTCDDVYCRLAEQEEVVRDNSRTLSVLQVRTKYLEEENGNLQVRIDSVTRQKHNLDRIVKEFQLERHREVRNCIHVHICF